MVFSAKILWMALLRTQLLAVEVPRLPVAVVGGEVETAAWSMSNSLRHCYDPRWSVNFCDVDTGFHVHHVGPVFLVGWLVTLVVVSSFVMSDSLPSPRLQ